MAATLMHWKDMHWKDVHEGKDDQARAAAVLESVNRLSRERRERLRELVDWVEAYEQAERPPTGTRANRT